MKRNILNKLLTAGCLLVMIMVSCKAKKLLVNTPAVPPATVVKPVNRMNAVKEAQLNFNTFSAKANTTLGIDANNNDVILNIRINRDREIWVSVAATILNVEVARAVITPDSINIINKLQGVYIKKPFSYVYKYANKQINYKMLESLLVGNAIPEILNDNNADFKPASENTEISDSLQELLYKLLLGPDMKVRQFSLSNQSVGQSLQVNNNAFIQVDGKIVPSQIDIQSVSQNKKIQVNLHYTKVDIDQPLQYPFSIPERYTPADEN
jgi:hypothetical protein